jgi:hypothetical protein
MELYEIYNCCPAKISPWSITDAESIASGELRVFRFEPFPSELDAKRPQPTLIAIADNEG